MKQKWLVVSQAGEGNGVWPTACAHWHVLTWGARMMNGEKGWIAWGWGLDGWISYEKEAWVSCPCSLVIHRKAGLGCFLYTKR